MSARLSDDELANLVADAGLETGGATDRDSLIDLLLDAGITGPDDIDTGGIADDTDGGGDDAAAVA